MDKPETPTILGKDTERRQTAQKTKKINNTSLAK